LIRHSKPVIAAVNGAAIGIGVTLILPMDQIIAAADAKFGLSFVRMGLVPELGGSGLVQRRIGFGAASRLLLTGEHLSALEALEINLVDQVVPAEALLDESKQLARRMSLNPRSAILAIKALLTENANETDLDKVQRREAAALTECYSSPEHKEAVAAFKEKRVPNFKLARQ
jgi:enoyl-CoA hydratase/carnithine racemase